LHNSGVSNYFNIHHVDEIRSQLNNYCHVYIRNQVIRGNTRPRRVWLRLFGRIGPQQFQAWILVTEVV